MKKPQKNSPRFSVPSFWTAGESKLRLPLGVMMGTMASGAIALLPLAAQAASLTQWHYDPNANRLEVTLDQGITPRYFLMAQPARIILDLPDTAVGAVQSQATYSGAVRQIRVSQFQPGLTRIVLELSPDVELAPGQVKLEKAHHPTETSRWVLRPLIAQAAPVQPSAKVSVPKVSAPKSVTPTVSEPAPPTQSAVPLPPPERPGTVAPAPFPVESPAPVRVPPLSSQPVPSAPANSVQTGKSTPAQVVQAEKILPPPTPIPIGSDDGLKVPDLPQQAQALPPASQTSLPPTSSPSELAIDTRNAIKISVPPPLSGIPTATQTPATVKPIAPTATPSLAPASVTPPASSPAKLAPAVVTPPVVNSLVLDMPSTVRVAPSAASSISVPPLENSKTGSVPPANPAPPLAPVQTTTPLPPQMQLPSLAPLPSAASSVPSGQAPVITVPPLAPSSIQTAPPGRAPVGSLPMAQPAIVPLAPAASVPLQATPSFGSPKLAAPPPSTQSSTVAFGQPLPTTGAIALNTFPRGVATYPAATSQPVQPVNVQSSGMQPGSVQQAFFQSPNPSVLLPLGATLNLVYPGNTALKLSSGPPLQEVLLLQTEVRDTTGAVVFPQGTVVLGRFDSSGNGSKFIAQAIAVGERTIPFTAESNSLGNNRELSTTTMAIGSGVGALLGGIVSSFSGLGLVGGAAAGAATSFLTSPKQVTIQPGQVIQVQVKQDLLIR